MTYMTYLALRGATRPLGVEPQAARASCSAERVRGFDFGEAGRESRYSFSAGEVYKEKIHFQRERPPSVLVFLGSSLSLRALTLTRCVPKSVSTMPISPIADLSIEKRVDRARSWGASESGREREEKRREEQRREAGGSSRWIEDVRVEGSHHLAWLERAERASRCFGAAGAL